MRECEHGMPWGTCESCEIERLRAAVRRYQLNERSHYKRAASYVAKQYHEKAERLVHENVSLRGRIEALKKEHEQQVRWREADSHYWYQRGFKAERLLKEARAERDEARAEAGRLRDLVQRLTPYAIHLENCDIRQWDDNLSACGCELFQVLAEAERAATENTPSR